jgi:activator of 2-hydroxyglutaryl-CoA dehydratase
LKEILRYNLPLALGSNSEKARSEMIIAPILVDLRRQLQERVNLFSGIEFDVDKDKGLNGFCDFIISESPEQLFINAPVITLVEAKREDIMAGLGQCVAEMVAAQIFNEREGNDIPVVYGAVTSGTNWRFLRLEEQVIEIDLIEYYLSDVNKILGILASAVKGSL